MVEGRVIDIKAITELANMPSKEELYSKLLYLINAPAQRLVTALGAVGRNLAVVVDQGVKENKFQRVEAGLVTRCERLYREGVSRLTWRTSTQLRIRFRA